MKLASALVVDDSKEDCYLLSRQLKATGLVGRIFESHNGKEALEFFLNHQNLSQKHPDEFPPLLVFLDINMPILDGYGFLREYAKLRTENDNLTSVFLMYTSSTQKAEKTKAFAYDFVKDYLVKGKFSATDLKNLIEELV